MSHGIGLPPIIALGSKELKQRVAPGVIAGETISALAITTVGIRSRVVQDHPIQRSFICDLEGDRATYSIGSLEGGLVECRKSWSDAAADQGLVIYMSEYRRARQTNGLEEVGFAGAVGADDHVE